jgi:hypothetical protein
MPDIFPSLRDLPVFEPDVTHAMSVAFEEVCRALKLNDDARGAREVIAARIIELARRGERDHERLRDKVLGEAGVADGQIPLSTEGR